MNKSPVFSLMFGAAILTGCAGGGNNGETKTANNAEPLKFQQFTDSVSFQESGLMKPPTLLLFQHHNNKLGENSNEFNFKRSNIVAFAQIIDRWSYFNTGFTATAASNCNTPVAF